MSQKGRALPASTLEKKRLKYENKANRQYLIPEILDIHPIPASFWRKAVCLPSILHRINCLLAAEDLRRRIAEQTDVGIIIPPIGLSFPHLQMDWENMDECKATGPFQIEPDLPPNYPYKDQVDWDEPEPAQEEVPALAFPMNQIALNTNLFIHEKNIQQRPQPITVFPQRFDMKTVADIGPTPDQILQTLTLSKASDGFNLERLEMLGDCFLKYAVTVSGQ